MRYGDFVDAMAEEWEVSAKEAHGMLAKLWANIHGNIQKGEKLSVRKFGTFYKRDVKARKARNPRTGEALQTTPHSKLGFKGAKFE